MDTIVSLLLAFFAPFLILAFLLPEPPPEDPRPAYQIAVETLRR